MFRVQISIWLHMFFRLYLHWQWAHSNLQLLFQPWTYAPGTHYGWVDRSSVEYEVCPTLLHMVSTGNRTPDLLIFIPIHLATSSHTHRDMKCAVTSRVHGSNPNWVKPWLHSTSIVSLMAEWVEPAFQGYEMCCYDLEFMGWDPGYIELGVHNTSEYVPDGRLVKLGVLGHEVCCHYLEVMGSNPSQVELEVYIKYFCVSHTWTNNITQQLKIVTYIHCIVLMFPSPIFFCIICQT